MNFRAIMFDLDGTLLDTLDDLTDSANRTLQRFGFPIHDRDAFRYFVGDGAPMLVRRMLPEDHRDEETVSNVLASYREDYNQNWDAKTRPYEGIPEMLDKFAQLGLKLTVLSNKPDDATQLCVTKLLPHWSFDIVLGHREGTPHKPDPTAALNIAQRMNIPPEQFLYMGDTGVDMQTAVSSGMFALGVLWGFRARDELLQAGAQVVLDHPMDAFQTLA